MYTTKVESELSEQVPVLKTQLPKTVKVEGRERFLLELYCDGHPLPTGMRNKSRQGNFVGTVTKCSGYEILFDIM